MKETFKNMLRHMAWADRRIGSALAAAEDAPAEAVKWYAHIVGAETIWLSRIQGGDSYPVPVFPAWDVAASREASEETLTNYSLFLETCDDYDKIAVYRLSTGAEARTSVSDILTHVFLHGSYHRGQINAKLRGAGLEPTPVDYILYARENHG